MNNNLHPEVKGQSSTQGSKFANESYESQTPWIKNKSQEVKGQSSWPLPESKENLMHVKF